MNCKTKLKLKWTRLSILAPAGVEKLMLILIILFSLSKTHNCMFLQSLYQQNIIKNYENFLAKDLKDQCIGMNIKQKVRIKIQQMNIYIFPNQTLVGLTECLFQFRIFKSRIYFLPKGIIKNYNVIIYGKNFDDQLIDSDIKSMKK